MFTDSAGLKSRSAYDFLTDSVLMPSRESVAATGDEQLASAPTFGLFRLRGFCGEANPEFTLEEFHS